MGKIEKLQALLEDQIADVDTRAKLLAMPLIQFPQDYATLVGVNEKTAYDHAKKAGFPPLITVGRQKMLRTETLVAWLVSLEGAEDEKDAAT